MINTLFMNAGLRREEELGKPVEGAACKELCESQITQLQTAVKVLQVLS